MGRPISTAAPLELTPTPGKEPTRMTLYLAHTHRRQNPGAHRKPTRWSTFTGWIRNPRKARS